MIKASLALVSLLFISSAANALLIERDWLVAGDNGLTYVSDLNIEILDVSYTNLGHAAVANELKNGSMYAGFRFMNSSEIFSVLDIFLGGQLDSRNAAGDLSLHEADSVSNFLNLIGGSSESFFNTCEFAMGCEIYPNLSALMSGNRHIINSNFIFHNDDNDGVSAQLLVRHVPEPSTLMLLLVGFFGMAVLRRRYRA